MAKRKMGFCRGTRVSASTHLRSETSEGKKRHKTSRVRLLYRCFLSICASLFYDFFLQLILPTVLVQK